MGIYSSVDCDEVFSSREESLSAASRGSKVKLRCTWANRKALALDLLATPRTDPEDALLQCTEVQINPEASKYTEDGQQAQYTNAIVSVTYGIPGGDNQEPTPEDPVKLASETIEPYTRVITQSYKNFKWASDDKALKEGEEPGKVYHGVKLVRTQFYLTALLDEYFDLPGSVNNSSYISSFLGKTFAAETLLFIPPVISRSITTAGATAWTLRLAYDYNQHGWNKVWRIDTQTWDSILVKDTGAPYKSYPPEDHSAILF